MTDPELLSAAIEASGLSVRRFWRDVLYPVPQTVRTLWRWLDGQVGAHGIPEYARKKCQEVLDAAKKGVATDAGTEAPPEA